MPRAEPFFVYFGKGDKEEFPFLDLDGAIKGSELVPQTDQVTGEAFLRSLGSHLSHSFRGNNSKKNVGKVFGELRKSHYLFESKFDKKSKQKRDEFFKSELNDVVDRNTIGHNNFEILTSDPYSRSNKVFLVKGSDGMPKLLILVPHASLKSAYKEDINTVKEEAKLAEEGVKVIQQASEVRDVIDFSDFTVDADSVKPTEPSHIIEEFAERQVTNQQKLVVNDLIALTKQVLGDFYNKFTEVRFLIISPRFVSLRAQTSKRAVEYGVVKPEEANKVIVPHDIDCYYEWVQFQDDLLDHKKSNTLFVIVDDECHYGPTAEMAHDVLVNFSKWNKQKDESESKALREKKNTGEITNEMIRKRILLKSKTSREEALNKENLLILQVSATPQNCLTEKTRIKNEHIVRWSYESESLFDLELDDVKTSLYRSLDSTIESFCWRLLPKEYYEKTQDLRRMLEPDAVIADASDWGRIEFKKPDGKYIIIDDLGEKVRFFVFAPFDFDEFWMFAGEVFSKHSELQGIRTGVDKSSGEPRLYLRFPHFGWSLKLNSFTRNVLGFGESSNSKTNAVDDGLWLNCSKSILIGQRLPELCNPKHAGASPLAYQHIRSDESVQSMLEEWTKESKKRTRAQSTKKGKTSATKQTGQHADPEQISVETIVEHETHILIADYIISLAYYAFFRLKPEFDPAKTIEERPQDGPVLVELKEGELPTRDVITRNVKRMLDALSDITKTCTGWSSHKQCLKGFDKTLEYVKKNFEDEAKESNLVDKDETSETEIWTEIITEKINHELHSLSSNDRLSWFTESDRLIGMLLDVDQPSKGRSRKGWMAFTRVYGTDRALLLQVHLREVMKKFGMYFRDERPIFAVLSDNGNVDLAGEMEREKWANVDLDSGKSETFKTRITANRFSGYEALQDIPCLVLLCQKGRMGDTFPQSLRLIDVRGRSSNGKYTSMIQEFGRLCRYPRLDATWRHDIVKDEDNGMDTFHGIAKEALQAAVKSMQAGYPVALFRPETPDRIETKDIAENSKFIGQAEFLDQLYALARRSRPGDVLLRYSYPLPTLLVSNSIYNLLRDAIRVRNDIAQNRGLLQHMPSPNMVVEQGNTLRQLPRITECICMDVDQFMEKITKRQHGAKEQADGALLDPNGRFKCLTDVYRANYTATGKHFDAERTSGDNYHHRRLLLFAECQMGKTGVFLGFLRELQKQIGGRPRTSLDEALEGLSRSYQLLHHFYDVDVQGEECSPEWLQAADRLKNKIAEISTVDNQGRQDSAVLISVWALKDVTTVNLNSQLSFCRAAAMYKIRQNPRISHLIVLGPAFVNEGIRDLRVDEFVEWTANPARNFAAALENNEHFFVKCFTRAPFQNGQADPSLNGESIPKRQSAAMPGNGGSQNVRDEQKKPDDVLPISPKRQAVASALISPSSTPESKSPKKRKLDTTPKTAGRRMITLDSRQPTLDSIWSGGSPSRSSTRNESDHSSVAAAASSAAVAEEAKPPTTPGHSNHSCTLDASAARSAVAQETAPSTVISCSVMIKVDPDERARESTLASKLADHPRKSDAKNKILKRIDGIWKNIRKHSDDVSKTTQGPKPTEEHLRAFADYLGEIEFKYFASDQVKVYLNGQEKPIEWFGQEFEKWWNRQ